jgi:hypothetical protein
LKLREALTGKGISYDSKRIQPYMSMVATIIPIIDKRLMITSLNKMPTYSLGFERIPGQ